MATTLNSTEGGKGDEHDGGDDKQSFTIIVNNQRFETSSKKLTGLQIKSLAGIPADYELFAVHGSTTVPVGNAEVINVKKDAEFRAIPAGTFGGGVRATAASR
jgi:hypothetical protein